MTIGAERCRQSRLCPAQLEPGIRKGFVMLCIVYALAQLGLVMAVSAAFYPVGWLLGDLYEKRKEARAARAAMEIPTTVGV